MENTAYILNSVISSENLTIAAESYHEGAEPNQTKLICTRKRHNVKKRRIRQIDEQDGSTQNMSRKPHVLY